MKTSTQTENIKITHIYHSGVMIETKNKVLIIDYFHEEGAFDEEAFLHSLNQSSKDFFYFVTHGHHDHFTEKIFSPSFQSPTGNTYYIFSEDLKNFKNAHNNITFCRPYEEFHLSDMTIASFGSTDQGVSYLIEIEESDVLIFHSGDLNWWHWNHFSDEDKLQEKQDFFKELEKIQAKLLAKNHSLNVAFVPVDPRLEDSYHLAGNAFLESLQPEKMFPLHFRNHYSITKKFKLQSFHKNVVEAVEHPMDTFEISF